MTIHLGNVTITGWIEDLSEHLGESPKYTLHVRKFRSSKAGALDRYDTPLGMFIRNYDDAEKELLKQCYDVANNELLLQNIPF